MGEAEKQRVARYLKEHPNFTKSWFVDNIGESKLELWLQEHETSSGDGSVDTISADKDNDNQIVSSFRPSDALDKKLIKIERATKPKIDLSELSERDQFLELIRDIANELDVNVLCHKILKNVSLLTNSDRGSLFLARGRKDMKYLVPVLFDVSRESDIKESLVKEEDQFRIPFGLGIAGSVAKTKLPINIKDAYKDPRFNKDVDVRTGYKTENILGMPIMDYEGEVIGVAIIMNKTDARGALSVFDTKDEEVFKNYVGFCGIGLANAQLFEMSVQEYKRNQMLLMLAHNVFEKQDKLDDLLLKIVIDAKDLLKCERCRIYLLENTHNENTEALLKLQVKGEETHVAQKHSIKTVNDVIFTSVIEILQEGPNTIANTKIETLQCAEMAEIAKTVAVGNHVLVIDDVATNPDFKYLLENEDFSVKCALNIPIINSSKSVIGVIQLINRITGKQLFTQTDINIVESFAIFCGLGIFNCQMYESAFKLMAKQSVALDCLSYHVSATQEDVNNLKNAHIAEAADFKLYTWEFDDYGLSDFDTCKAALRMMLECNVVNEFHVPYEVLCRWILSVKKSYRPVTYHNWRHGFNVAQSMFTMIYTGGIKKYFSSIEVFSLLVACFCHDLDHRGTNNAFQEKSDSPLAVLYSSSTMEHHHFDQCVMILNSEGNNIFQRMSPEEYREVMALIKNAIISTDLALYFKKKGLFEALLDNGEKDWNTEETKGLLQAVMMTGCDVAAICKPWEIQYRVAHLVAGEFFEQGDAERIKLGLEPIAMMDRQKQDQLPKMQVGFINFICTPVYTMLARMEPGLQPLLDGCMDNRTNWQRLADEAEKTVQPSG